MKQDSHLPARLESRLKVSLDAIAEEPSDSRGTLLFHREYRRLSGGHLKVWHYLGHTAASRSFRPKLYLTPRSSRDRGNIFLSEAVSLVEEWCPERADALFVGGLDWQALPGDGSVPVVNLIQGLSHAQPDNPRRDFLRRRAVRICVSGEVADAIQATGLVNGPVYTIANAIELPGEPPTSSRPPIPLLVAGWKDRRFTVQVVAGLRAVGLQPVVIDSHLPQQEFLARLAAARVVVLLPLQLEGCFLPALEAFALGCLVVCPDCVGNRQFCRDGETCFRPAHDPQAIVAATAQALALPQPQRERIIAAARAEAAGRGLDAERRAYLAILDNLADIW